MDIRCACEQCVQPSLPVLFGLEFWHEYFTADQCFGGVGNAAPCLAYCVVTRIEHGADGALGFVFIAEAQDIRTYAGEVGVVRVEAALRNLGELAESP